MKYFHAEKDGNCGQGIVGVGGLVYTTVSLYVEGLGGDGIDMCNLNFSLIKGGYVGHLQWDIIS